MKEMWLMLVFLTIPVILIESLSSISSGLIFIGGFLMGFTYLYIIKYLNNKKMIKDMLQLLSTLNRFNKPNLRLIK